MDVGIVFSFSKLVFIRLFVNCLNFFLLFSRMIAGCSKSMAEFDVSAQVLKMVFRLPSEHFHMRSNKWSRFRPWWFRREINYVVNLYTLLYGFKYFERLWLCVNHLNYLWRIIYGNVAKTKIKIVPYNICIRPVFSEVFSYLCCVFWSFNHGEDSALESVHCWENLALGL